METIVLKVKTENAAKHLADFLQTIEYITGVERTDNIDQDEHQIYSMTKGNYQPQEKPSDYAGIWKNRKQTDIQKLRKKAWQRKK